MHNNKSLGVCTIFLVLLFLSFNTLAGKQMLSFNSEWGKLKKEKLEMPGSKLEFIRRNIVDGETLDLAELHIFAETIPAGATSPRRLNKDKYEELMIVKSGTIIATNAQKSSLRFGPGSVVVSQPGEARTFVNAGNTPATYYIFNYRTRLPKNMERSKKAGGSIMVDWKAVAYMPSKIGGRRNIFNRPTSMFDTFEMHVSTLNKGLTNHPLHTHRAEEFVLMIEGEVEMLVGEKTVRAAEGDLIYIESMIPHSLNNTGRSATTYFAFQFWQ